MKTEIIRPSKIYYGISVLIFVSGMILFIVTLITGIKSSVNQVNIQVVIPGTEVIELKESGKYNVFYEYRSVINGKVFVSDNLNGMMCTLKNIETGEFVELNNTSVNCNYSLQGRKGESILDFTIEKPGKYELNAWSESGNGEESVLAIGKGFSTMFVRTVLLSIGIFFLSITLSIIVFIVIFTKRKRTKNKKA